MYYIRCYKNMVEIGEKIDAKLSKFEENGRGKVSGGEVRHIFWDWTNYEPWVLTGPKEKMQAYLDVLNMMDHDDMYEGDRWLFFLERYKGAKRK